MLAWTPRFDASPTWTLTTVLFVAVVRAVVVIVAPPDGGDAPPVVALKLSILTLIRRWRERGIKEKGGSGSTRISNNVADALKSVVQLPFANEWMNAWLIFSINLGQLTEAQRGSQSVCFLLMDYFKAWLWLLLLLFFHDNPCQHEDKDAVWTTPAPLMQYGCSQQGNTWLPRRFFTHAAITHHSKAHIFI